MRKSVLKKAAALLTALSFAVSVTEIRAYEDENKEYEYDQTISSVFRSDLVPREVLNIQFQADYVSPFAFKQDSNAYNREKKYCTPVKNQGSDGVCWAFAAAADYEAALLKYLEDDKNSRNIDLSESHLRYALSPDGNNVYAGTERSFASYGNFEQAMMYFTRSVCGGPVAENADPYSDRDGVRDGNRTLDISDKYRIGYYPQKSVNLGIINPQTDYGRESLDEFTAAVKNQIKDNGVVQCSYDSSADTLNDENYGATFFTDSSEFNHGVSIVGWDDSIPASAFPGSPDGDGAWLVKNSWGSYWGNEGYFWMSYYTPMAAYSIESVIPEYDTIYEHDRIIRGKAGFSKVNDSEVLICNRYTAVRNEKITGLGTYTSNPDAYYRFYISVTGNPEDFQELELSNAEALGLDEKTEKGYYVTGANSWYTFQFSQSAAVAEGEDFLIGYTVNSVSDGTYFPSQKGTYSGKTYYNVHGTDSAYTEKLTDSGTAAVIKAFAVSDNVTELSAEKCSIKTMFDYHDDDSCIKTSENTIILNTEKIFSENELNPDDFAFSSDREVYVPAQGISAVLTETSDDTYEIRISAEKSSYSGEIYLFYKRKAVPGGTADYSVTETFIDSGVEDGYFSYSGDSALLDIKNQYGSEKVTGIAEKGLYGNRSIREVTVPEGVTEIGSEAFGGCTGLIRISIPDSVTDISSDAFDGCSDNLVIICSEIVRERLSAENISVITADSESVNNTGEVSCFAGENLHVSLANGQITQDGRIKGFISLNGKYTPEISDVKWVLENSSGKPSANAKFYDNIRNKYGLTCLKYRKETDIGALKSDGNFESTAVLKAVSVLDKNIVYALCMIHVIPQRVTCIKAVTGGNSRLTETGKNEYSLSLKEGEIWRLPVYAENGEDKTLLYDTSQCTSVSVINGCIHGIKATGTGPESFLVYPQYGDKDSVFLKINVTVKPKITRGYVNVKSISCLCDGTEQKFTVGAVPVSDHIFDITMKYNDKAYTVYRSDGITTVKSGERLSVTAAEEFSAASAGFFTLKSSDRIISVKFENASSGKEQRIKINDVSDYSPVKKISEKYRKKNTDGYTVINLPCGTAVSLGISVLPLSADNRFVWKNISGNGTEPVPSGIQIKGETVTGTEAGTYYIQAVSAADDGIVSGMYKINVYRTGSSFVMEDDNYTVTAGTLVSREFSDTGSSKQIPGGKNIEIRQPYIPGSTEKILWSTGHENAVNLQSICRDEGNACDLLRIKILVPGVYTVTGRTEYTKQKYTFKVRAEENISSNLAGKYRDSEKIEFQMKNSAGTWEVLSSGAAEILPGHSEYIRIDTTEVCGSVEYISSAPDLVSVDSRGRITVHEKIDEPVYITALIIQKSVPAAGCDRPCIERKLLIL